MSSTLMNFKVLHALEVVQRVEKTNDRYTKVIGFLGWLVDGWVAHRIGGLSFKIADLVESMKVTALVVDRGEQDLHPLDTDSKISDKLDYLKQEVHVIRNSTIKNLEEIAKNMPKTSVRLKELSSICGELYEATNQLQWEIAEHDVKHAQRYAGFVASSAEELTALLDKISAD